MEHGVLKIVGRVFKPEAGTFGTSGAGSYRRVTLATYPCVTEEECAELVEWFAGENHLRRGDLWCTWTRTVLV